MVLEIKHRDDVPFGELLLSKSEIHIESKKWKTPLNYIFSKLFSKGMLHEELRNASVDDLSTILTKSRETMHTQMLSKCLTQYLETKMKVDAAFVSELVRTGPTTTLVCKRDIFPQNIYGKLLEQLRNHTGKRDDDDDTAVDRSQDPVYYMYLASKALKEILCENNLEEFLDQKFKRMSDLLRALQERYGRERIFRKAPDRETIMKIHKQLEVDYTTSPSALIRLVRRKHIRRVRELALAKIKTIVLDEFINSIRHLHPALPQVRDAVIERERQSIDVKKNIQLLTRANNLWNERKLPEDVMRRIDDRVKRIYVPSEEEIERYETDVFLLYPGSEVNRSTTPAAPTALTIEPKSRLHPYSVDQLKMDDGLTYPTCVHYYVVKAIVHENPNKEARDVLRKLRPFETRQLLDVLAQWRQKYRSTLFENIVNQTLYIYFKDARRQHLLLCTGKEPLNMNCPLIKNLSTKMMKIRASLTPTVYSVTSLDHVRDIYLVKEWCQHVNEFSTTLHKLLTSWLKDKGSEKSVSQTEMIRYFFHGHHASNEDMQTSILSTFRRYNNDLSIVDFILKRQYIMSNTWVRPPGFTAFTATLRDSMTLLALCRLMLVFDRLCDVKITLNDIDVNHAKAILTHYVREEQEYVDDDDRQPEAEEENDEYDDDDVEEYNDEYDQLEFEGNDVLFRYLKKYAFNDLSDYIETSLYQCLKTIDIGRNRSRINFFAGINL